AVQTAVVEHVEEVGIAAEIQLVGAGQAHTPVLKQAGKHTVYDGGTHLALDVVADDGQVLPPEALRPLGIGGDEHRDGVHESSPSPQSGLGIIEGSFFGAYGQVAHQHIGPSLPQHLGHIHGRQVGHFERAVFGIVLHVGAGPVQHGPHLDYYAGVGNVAMEYGSAVGLGEEGLVEGAPHLPRVDIEGCHNLYVARSVTADIRRHEP